MGQKVNPVGLRVGINRDWDASWYAKKNEVADLLHEDLKIRNFLENEYVVGARTFKNNSNDSQEQDQAKKAKPKKTDVKKNLGISRVVIERFKKAKKETDGTKSSDSKSTDAVKVTIYTSQPGLIIGNQGSEKDRLKKQLEHLTKKDVLIVINEIKRPDMDAQLVAKRIATDLENRASFRRVQKIAIQRALKSGAKGAKTLISGRLAGAEMARSEGYNEGQVPLHTLRADVDYATAEAKTTYGILGVKVWIYKGEVQDLNERRAIEKRANDIQRKRPAARPGGKTDSKNFKKPTTNAKRPQGSKGGN